MKAPVNRALLVGLCLLPSVRAAESSRLLISTDTVLTTDLVVDSSQTCEVAPGVTVRLDGYRRAVVQGILIANGTEANPILFIPVGRPRG